MPPQHDDITHMNSAATVILEMDTVTNLNQASAPRRTVLKMSFAEKAVVLEMFLGMDVVEKREEELTRTFQSIAQSMRNRQDVLASTKASITEKSVETYRRNYAQPLLNSAKRGGPFVRLEMGDLQLYENGYCVVEENEMEEMERWTKGSRAFCTALLQFDKAILKTMASTKQLTEVASARADSIRSSNQENHNKRQRSFSRRAKKAAKHRKQEPRYERLTQQHRTETSTLFAKLQSQNTFALHAIASAFVVKKRWSSSTTTSPN